MNQTMQKLEKDIIRFDCVCSAEDMAAMVKTVYETTKGRYSVPGFRKGHAPQKVIERMYGEGVFVSEAVNRLIDRQMENVMWDKQYNIFCEKEVVDVDVADNGELKFSTVFVTYPEVKLGKYTELSAKKDEVKITDADVNAYVDAERAKRARLIDAEVAALGDTVTMDFVGKKDGVAFDGGTGYDYDLELGSHSFIPGFEEGLVGVKTGETRDVKVTFPEDYHEKSLAGAEATFACTVKKVLQKQLPEFNDEFVSESSEFSTVAEYKADVKAKLEKRAEQEAEYKYDGALVDEVVNGSEVEVRDEMIEKEADAMQRDVEERVKRMGATFDDYLYHFGKSFDEFREEIKTEAKERLKTRLVLEAVLKAENIDVSNDEINARIEDDANKASETVEQFKKSIAREKGYIDRIVNEMLTEKLLALFKGKAKPVEKKAKQKAEAADGEAKKPAPKKTTKSASEKSTDAE